MKFGYYSKPFKFNPKGKVIGMNSMLAYDVNWMIWKNRSDPGNFLKWLEVELSELEKI